LTAAASDISTGFDYSGLLESGDPRARTLLYQRLLYSPSVATLVQSLLRGGGVKASAATVAFLGSIDFERLAVEQWARLRNLSGHLARSCPGLHAVLPREQVEGMLARFVDSADFWTPSGRTLAENFCLYVHRQAYPQLHPSLQELARDMAHLDGIISGLCVDAPSPWDEALEQRTAPALGGALKTESFISEWHLIDSEGRLPTAENYRRVVFPGRCRVLAAKFPHQIVLVALDLQGQTAA
jgi:hypothetical protein